jgi:drug/metabolite transporter (DMT)-like permease
MNRTTPLNVASPTSASIEAEAYLLGVLSVAAFALTLPCAKVLAGHLSAIQIGLFRSALAGLVALPILLFTGSARPNRSQIKRLFLMSLGVVYGFPVLTAVGMQYVPVGHGGVVLAALPLSTAIFGSLITKDRPPILFWLASVGGFIAVALFAVWRSEVGGGFYSGDLALLGAVVLAGFGYAQGGALSKEMKGWEVMCWALVLNLPILLMLSMWQFDARQFIQFDSVQWSALAFLAFVNSLLGFFSWNRALALGGIQRISQLQLLQPFFTYAYSIVLMGEKFDPLALLVCTFVIALVVVSKRALKKPTLKIT